ncbi:predicted protein [Histoplasma capsulatum H143]|uniref:Uncharacterized protein n=1 Tax=Ajellomyces capsulatus (strain H143) TaxID=544712 RepID=C6H807_AJECH|nr:predicted protein [Histoplasma capsulatum H143]
MALTRTTHTSNQALDMWILGLAIMFAPPLSAYMLLYLVASGLVAETQLKDKMLILDLLGTSSEEEQATPRLKILKRMAFYPEQLEWRTRTIEALEHRQTWTDSKHHYYVQGPSSTDLDQPQGLPPTLRPLFKWRRFSGFAMGRPNEFRDETLWWFGDLAQPDGEMAPIQGLPNTPLAAQFKLVLAT